MKIRPRRCPVLRLALVALLVAATMAAAPGDLHHAEAAASSNERTVSGSCQAVAGVYTDLNTMTFGIRAHAEAHDGRWVAIRWPDVEKPTNPTIPQAQPSGGPPPAQVVQEVAGIATSVSCLIRDAETDHVYGRVAAGQPGPTATAIGSVQIPADVYVRAEVCVTALYLDGERLHSCE